MLYLLLCVSPLTYPDRQRERRTVQGEVEVKEGLNRARYEIRRRCEVQRRLVVSTNEVRLHFSVPVAGTVAGLGVIE